MKTIFTDNGLFQVIGNGKTKIVIEPSGKATTVQDIGKHTKMISTGKKSFLLRLFGGTD